ncbi:MAG: glycerol-3-phosphate acyltransferase [Chloroflexi bacterium]|nr:glycerol-3-phosphate acyltransferase [Chloroflexota bacterium]
MSLLHGLTIWNVLLGLSVGYLLGSFPSGVAMARLFGGPDPRTLGSTHTGATNVFRNVNRLAGVVTGLIDLGKGALAVWLVLQIVPNPWMIPLAGMAAVAGHCWPVFTQFRGGMGIATAGGLALWFFPLLIPIFLALYFLIQRFVRHQARTVMLLTAFIPFILYLLGVRGPQLTLGIGISLILIVRWSSDFNRVYD